MYTRGRALHRSQRRALYRPTRENTALSKWVQMPNSEEPQCSVMAEKVRPDPHKCSKGNISHEVKIIPTRV